MDVKEYLNQIDRLDKMIQNKICELEQIKQSLTSISIPYDREKIQTSGEKDKIGSAVCKIIDIENEITELVEQFTQKRKTIVNQIDNLENSDYYHVLSMRYVLKKTFEEISYNTNWSIRKVFSLHAKALVVFDEKYKNFYENEFCATKCS